MSSLLARIPRVVQRALCSDAACQQVMLCSWSEGGASIASPNSNSAVHLIPTSDFLANASSTDVAERNEDDLMLVYDVMRVHTQRVLFHGAHMHRIATSYESVASSPLSAGAQQLIQQSIASYIESQDSHKEAGEGDAAVADKNLKFLTWVSAHKEASSSTDGGDNTILFLVYFIRSHFPPAEWYVTGTDMALLFNAHRTNPNAKVVQATLRERARQMQAAAHVHEVLLVHEARAHYLIPEGSRSNYFIITRDRRILCSAEEDILVGITLQAARRAVVSAGLGAVEHAKLTLVNLLQDAESLVMLGTSPGVLPVREVVLYYDAATRKAFYEAMSECGMDMSNFASKISVTGSGTAEERAALQLVVSNEVTTKLMDAYQEEALIRDQK